MIVQFVRDMDSEANTVSYRRGADTRVCSVETRLDAFREGPGLPWHNIRGIGNWIRHSYDRVDVETVWITVIDHLPPLRSGVLRALTPPPANP